VLPKSALLLKKFRANDAIKIFHTLVNFFDVLLQIPAISKLFNTNATLKMFGFLADQLKMSSANALPFKLDSKRFSANDAYTIFTVLMNEPKMLPTDTFSCKLDSANAAFKFFDK